MRLKRNFLDYFGILPKLICGKARRGISWAGMVCTQHYNQGNTRWKPTGTYYVTSQTWCHAANTMEGGCLSWRNQVINCRSLSHRNSSPVPQNSVRRWVQLLHVEGWALLFRAWPQKETGSIKIPYYWFWPIGPMKSGEAHSTSRSTDFTPKAGRRLDGSLPISPKNSSIAPGAIEPEVRATCFPGKQTWL